LEGKDLREQSLTARRKLLANLLKKAPENVRLSEELRGSKDELLRVAQQFGLEGLVAKRKSSAYESGRRSGAWVKFKITKSQEFVIAATRSPKATGDTSDPYSLVHQSPDGLLFAGRIGTGFSEKLLASIDGQLQRSDVPLVPFSSYRSEHAAAGDWE
jgi:bifunctional non-homologous end joining protein LigD